MEYAMFLASGMEEDLGTFLILKKKKSLLQLDIKWDQM